MTDAGSKNGPQDAALIEAAIGRGELVQRLILMGREDLPASAAYGTGPLKLLYDESDLPDLAIASARIGTARSQGRAVAAHCVTLGELVFFLAALDEAGGAKPGDRIEHGNVIPLSLAADIAAAGLIVVTQPAFVRTRGDRYRAMIETGDVQDLYRLRSLLDAGIPLLAGSDAPYGSMTPGPQLMPRSGGRPRAAMLLVQTRHCRLCRRYRSISIPIASKPEWLLIYVFWIFRCLNWRRTAVKVRSH